MKRRVFMTGLAGATAMWPIAGRAQQTTKRVIGFLHSYSAEAGALFVDAFRNGLGETGYIEGNNLGIEYRWADGHYDRLPDLASDLVRRKVDLIATQGASTGILAAKAATSTIPIVFVSGSDPVADGLVASFARPGSNITGIAWLAVELMPKLVELILELRPQARRIGLLVNPNNASIAERITLGVQAAAKARRLELLVLNAGSESEIDAAFETLLRSPADGLVVGADPFFGLRREQLIAMAARYAVPAAYDAPEYAVRGGLVAYGAKVTSAYRQAGVYAGRILKGEKPADLPVQQPTKFELAINLKTAKALSLSVPQSLLARADEVIE